MAHKYAILIQPSTNIIEQIRNHKLNIKELIGNYNSYDVDAHITLNSFYAGDTTLVKWKEYLIMIQKTQQALHFEFDRTIIYSNQAFVMIPSENCSKLLLPFVKQFHANAPSPIRTKSSKPHLTIARQLTDDQMCILSKFRQQIHVEFTSYNLVLNRYNQHAKTYEQESIYPIT
jgi:2'-5' RNA ligase